MTTPHTRTTPAISATQSRYALSIGPDAGTDTPDRSPEFLARRRDLLNAVSGVALTERDVRLLDWLADWPAETTGALADLVTRARAALIGPTL